MKIDCTTNLATVTMKLRAMTWKRNFFLVRLFSLKCFLSLSSFSFSFKFSCFTIFDLNDTRIGQMIVDNKEKKKINCVTCHRKDTFRHLYTDIVTQKRIFNFKFHWAYLHTISEINLLCEWGCVCVCWHSQKFAGSTFCCPLY